MAAQFSKVYDLVRLAQLIPTDDLDAAAKTASHLNVPLQDVLIGRRLIPKDKLGDLIATSLGIGYINLKDVSIPKEVLSLLKEELAQERKVVPIGRDGYILHLAMMDPSNLETINFVRKITGLNVIPFFAFEGDIKFGLHQYKSSLTENFQLLIEQVAKQRPESETPQELARDVSIIQAVGRMLEFAVIAEASDIHIEALADSVLVRYRIDGVLHDMISLPKSLHPAIVARIKILSSLKLDETRLPQDGRLKFESDEGDVVSLRVSILPTVEGEKIVLRILESGELSLSLEDLGYDGRSVDIIKKALDRPHGMILITGPTGSGKTTNLYTMLNLLNTGEVNISTVEDPVENRIRRINQTQINSQINFSFAEGLRALLRQDPDVVMVGEIRDPETAGMAINAAMTGHLVLSTLHTNDSPGAIPRLIDLGAEPFLLASTLDLVIAQRLVRKICPKCQMTQPIDPKVTAYLASNIQDPIEKEMVMKVIPDQVRTAPGCDYCKYSGYLGRTGLYEMFTVNEEIRQLILEKSSANSIKTAALKGGMQTMLMDGVNKVADGITTFEEVLRVTRD
jgi:type IV pilus assembly protein PilB